MNKWLMHVKETKKKCPNMSLKEVLKAAKKTYNKETKTASPVKSCNKTTTLNKGKSRKSRKSRKSKKRKVRKQTRSRKGKSRKRRGKGKSRKMKVSKRALCSVYPNAPGC